MVETRRSSEEFFLKFKNISSFWLSADERRRVAAEPPRQKFRREPIRRRRRGPKKSARRRRPKYIRLRALPLTD
jgi:hypothetical protein